MKPKMILKLAVDIGMTAALLLLMAYELIEQARQDAEGLYTMRVLGRNMAYMLRCCYSWHMSWSGRQPMNGSALECLPFLSSTIS